MTLAATDHLRSALAHHRAGRLDQAEAIYRQVLADQPDHADAVHMLGMVLQRRGRADESVRLLARAVELDPSAAHLHANLGAALARLRRAEPALYHLRRAVQLKPDYAQGWQNLTRALEELERWGEAADAAARLAELRPGDADAWLRHGTACRKLNRPGASVVSLRRSVQLRPQHQVAWHALASSHGDVGDYRASAEAFRAAAELDPGHPHLGSDYLHLLHYDPAVRHADLLTVARAWARRHADRLTAQAAPHDNDPSPGRRLRVGFVSGDFREHPVGRLTAPLLPHLDRRRFELFCYDDAKAPDALTALLMAIPDIAWRQTHEMGDAALADRIRQDRIDVLFDLGGHMGGHRLATFARRPAPVQATQFNYPDTTGMTAIDWRISDPLAEPEGSTDAYSVERLCRLPRCAWCYDPGVDVPAVGPLPADANGHVTFASLNKPLKHAEETAALWARILAAVPGSRLLLLGWGDEREDGLLHARFAAHGVGRDRLLFTPRCPRPAYLDLYNRADVALDPFPYNGGVTSCDGLYMGVPLVALAGRSYHARQGLMLLTNLGLPELVADSGAAYVRLAVELANDLPRLRSLRAGLRDRMRVSPMMDGPAFAAQMGEACRRMWRDWCGRHGTN